MQKMMAVICLIMRMALMLPGGCLVWRCRGGGTSPASVRVGEGLRL